MHMEDCPVKRFKFSLLLLFVLLASLPGWFGGVAAQNEGRQPIRPKPIESEPVTNVPPTEAAVGFDNQTNGHIDQATYDADKALFAAVESDADGVGPVYNARSCGECHGNPILGAGSQILELRAAKIDAFGNYTDAPGGSLINDRAIHPAAQERVPEDANIIAGRSSLSILGDGYIEAIPDQAFIQVAQDQVRLSKGLIRGQVIFVPVLEAPGVTRVGRFGWKNQHASLVSFAGDAYLNEMGITTPMFPTENTSMGRPVNMFDPVPDPDEADNDDVEAFADFSRATKAPGRDPQLAGTPDAQRGEQLFNSLGCAVCHTPSFVTAPAGTALNGGQFVVTPALGNKIVRPWGDFLLHDIGTGDGIIQNGGPSTRNKVRTAPLWGVRFRTRLMHDGLSATFDEAIQRHAGEAFLTRSRYLFLNQSDRAKIQTFLRSL
jgi:CxxC motif-containing protein (DUF1111 family)